MVVDLTSVPYLDQSAAKAFIDWMSSVHDQCFPSIVAPEGKYSCSYSVDNHEILPVQIMVMTYEKLNYRGCQRYDDDASV